MKKAESTDYRVLYGIILLVLFLQFQAEVFQYERHSSEYWRFFTAHFTHWDWNHLCWDLLIFIILGKMLIDESLKTFYVIILLSPWLISALMWISAAEMQYYRGISGIDSALFCALACFYIRKSEQRIKLCGVLMLLLLGAKIIYEFVNTQALFVDTQSYYLMPWAHLGGALCGLLVYLRSIAHVH